MEMFWIIFVGNTILKHTIKTRIEWQLIMCYLKILIYNDLKLYLIDIN